MPNPAPAKRRVRTPAERAQEALDVVDRQIANVRKRMDAKAIELQDIEDELIPLEKRRGYLAANPDLPPQNVGKDSPVLTSDG